MTIDSSKSPQTTTNPGAAQPARTDDLLASGADSQDGARGFAGSTAPEALQTGMEGIAGATVQGNAQSAGRPAVTTQTVPDNAGQVRNKQGG